MSVAIAPFESFPESFIVNFLDYIYFNFICCKICDFVDYIVYGVVYCQISTSIIRILFLFLCGFNIPTVTLFAPASSSLINLLISFTIFMLDNGV